MAGTQCLGSWVADLQCVPQAGAQQITAPPVMPMAPGQRSPLTGGVDMGTARIKGLWLGEIRAQSSHLWVITVLTEAWE